VQTGVRLYGPERVRLLQRRDARRTALEGACTVVRVQLVQKQTGVGIGAYAPVEQRGIPGGAGFGPNAADPRGAKGLAQGASGRTQVGFLKYAEPAVDRLFASHEVASGAASEFARQKALHQTRIGQQTVEIQEEQERVARA